MVKGKEQDTAVAEPEDTPEAKEAKAKRSADTLEEQGFSFKSVETSAGGVTYKVEVPQVESWRTFYDFWKGQGHNPDEVLTKILNAQNEQGAKQGDKQAVREAIGKDDADARKAAIAAHQANARLFVMGAPRGGGGARHSTGLTAKQRASLGTKMAEVTQARVREGKSPTAEDINAIYEELGIDPDSL